MTSSFCPLAKGATCGEHCSLQAADRDSARRRRFTLRREVGASLSPAAMWRSVQKVETSITEMHGSVESHPLDVADSRALESAIVRFRPGALFCNAAVLDRAKVWDALTPERFAHVMSVNAGGTFNACSAAVCGIFRVRRFKACRRRSHGGSRAGGETAWYSRQCHCARCRSLADVHSDWAVAPNNARGDRSYRGNSCLTEHAPPR
jgi:hypothetical protein